MTKSKLDQETCLVLRNFIKEDYNTRNHTVNWEVVDNLFVHLIQDKYPNITYAIEKYNKYNKIKIVELGDPKSHVLEDILPLEDTFTRNEQCDYALFLFLILYRKMIEEDLL